MKAMQVSETNLSKLRLGTNSPRNRYWHHRWPSCPVRRYLPVSWASRISVP